MHVHLPPLDLPGGTRAHENTNRIPFGEEGRGLTGASRAKHEEGSPEAEQLGSTSGGRNACRAQVDVITL